MCGGTCVVWRDMCSVEGHVVKVTEIITVCTMQSDYSVYP